MDLRFARISQSVLAMTEQNKTKTKIQKKQKPKTWQIAEEISILIRVWIKECSWELLFFDYVCVRLSVSVLKCECSALLLLLLALMFIWKALSLHLFGIIKRAYTLMQCGLWMGWMMGQSTPRTTSDKWVINSNMLEYSSNTYIAFR